MIHWLRDPDVCIRVWLICAALMLAAAMAMVSMLFEMRSDWEPPPGFSSAVVFWTDMVPNAAHYWTGYLGLEVLWSVALVALVVTLLIVRTHEHFMRTMLAGQIALLGLFLFAPMTLDSDQYLYVAYGDLINMGYSPYDPPAKHAPLTPQLHEISTVWNNGEGGPDAKAQIVDRGKYGPAFMLAIATVLRPFVSMNPELQARVLRLFAVLTCVGVTLLLWGELRTRRWGPAALAAFALNPLVVTQVAVGAHDDLFAVLPALAAYRFAVRGRDVPAAFSLGVSVACKMTFAPFALPLLAFACARTRRSATVLAMVAILLAVPLLFALPFGWQHALIRPFHDAQTYNSSLLFAYVAGAVRRVTGSLAAARLARHWAGPALIVLCTVLIAAIALRRRRSPILEMGLLLLLFTAARQQTWYGLNLTPALLIPHRWAIGIFLGCTLASQVIQRKNFIGGWNAPPFVTFVILAVLLSAVLAVAFSATRERARDETPAEDGISASASPHQG